MLVVIATFIITWLFLGLIYYVTSDLTYKQCISSGYTVLWLVIIGWVPAVIVGIDLDEKPESPF